MEAKIQSASITENLAFNFWESQQIELWLQFGKGICFSSACLRSLGECSVADETPFLENVIDKPDLENAVGVVDGVEKTH